MSVEVLHKNIQWRKDQDFSAELEGHPMASNGKVCTDSRILLLNQRNQKVQYAMQFADGKKSKSTSSNFSQFKF